MPSNRFPDSPEKRALRRRDGQLLEHFASTLGHRLDYCGMPSVEFLDVDAWKQCLRSVVAVEYSSDVANDMRIERDRQQFAFPITIVEANVMEYLVAAPQPFDLFNLDFYTGFVNPTKGARAHSVDALRAVFTRQGQAQRSFTLVVTFNVRDRGASEYLKFLGAARKELSGLTNVEESFAAHEASQAGRLKICFPFFCSQQSHAAGFEQEVEGVYLYQTTATMVHFHQRFMVRKHDVLVVPARQALIDAANLPLYEMKGPIPHKKMVPPQIVR
jgi:hypothetical protein